MSAAVTLEPVYGLASRLVMQGDERMGIVFPPQASSEPWELWFKPDWVPHHFASEGEVLAALGIAAEPEARAA